MHVSALRRLRLVPLVRRLLVCAAALPLMAFSAPGELEAKIKAAYVFHVIKFVDWPNLPVDALRLCVSGSDPVGALLGELATRQVKDRPLRVDIDNGFDPAQCQVLFVGRGERRWAELQTRLRGGSVLTISDQDGFARVGGVVGFYSDGGRIRLEINPDAARNANLRISAKLLEVARTVPVDR